MQLIDTSSLLECGVNCHRKCEEKMPPLCGVNQKLLAEALSQVRRAKQRGDGSVGAADANNSAALSATRSAMTPAEKVGLPKVLCFVFCSTRKSLAQNSILCACFFKRRKVKVTSVRVWNAPIADTKNNRAISATISDPSRERRSRPQVHCASSRRVLSAQSQSAADGPCLSFWLSLLFPQIQARSWASSCWRSTAKILSRDWICDDWIKPQILSITRASVRWTGWSSQL